MARIMRLMTLSFCSLAAAQTPVPPIGSPAGSCLVETGEAVSDAMDASMFIWAATQRCGKLGQTVNCEIDIMKAMKSVNSMIDVVMKTVDKCHALHSENRACGLQAGQLTEHIEAFAASGASVSEKCHAPAQIKQSALPAHSSPPIKCSIDMKNAGKGLVKAIQALSQSKQTCTRTSPDSDERCAGNVLGVIGALAGMGQFVAGAIGQCKITSTPGVVHDGLCAKAAMGLVEYTTKIAEDGVKLDRKCQPKIQPVTPAPVYQIPLDHDYERDDFAGLYEVHSDAVVSPTSPVLSHLPSMNLILGALLPTTALVSFVCGRRSMSPRTDYELVEQSEDVLINV